MASPWVQIKFGGILRQALLFLKAGDAVTAKALDHCLPDPNCSRPGAADFVRHLESDDQVIGE